MKTIFRLLCGLMAIALTTACSHEELLQTEPMQKPAEGKMVSVKAYTPSEQPASRLAFDDQGAEGLKLSWSEGDAFTAVVGNDKVTFTYDANTKKFSGTLPDGATLTDGVNAYYPAYDGESFEMDLSQQTGALNSATTYMEGAYDATAQAFRFNHSTAILKVAFSGLPQDAEIESVVFSGDVDINITSSEGINKEAVYINLPALAKGSKLVFYVETTAGLYTSTQTVTVDAGIEVGKFYVASIVLEEATVGHLPGYSMTDEKNYFNEAVKNFLNNNPSLTKIKFIANSNNTNKDNRIGTSEPYMVAGSDNETLEIHTAAAEFVFNADCSSMFDGLSTITAIDFNNCVNTANVTNMAAMFYECSALTSLDLSSFNTSNVEAMNNIFYGCSMLTSLDVSNFNTSNVTDMYNMFDGCSKLTSLDLSNFNTSKVTTMASMFDGCTKLTSLNVSNFNTEKVTDMSYMFNNGSALASLDLSSFNTAKVTTMACMFCYCSNIAELKLINFDFRNVTDFDYMFYDLAKNNTESVRVYVYVTQDSYNILKDKDTEINSNYAWFVDENGNKYED